jgi:2-keto-myo-inositol isomerase
MQTYSGFGSVVRNLTDPPCVSYHQNPAPPDPSGNCDRIDVGQFRAPGAAIEEPQLSRKAGTSGLLKWPLCLNTSTIRPASLAEKIAIASQAGYSAIEPWSDELTAFESAGGTLAEIRKRLADAGLKVPSVIALSNWMQSEGQQKRAAFSEARRRMEQAAALGASKIVASPGPDCAHVDIGRAADRYRDLLQLGEETGVIPCMEFLGFQRNVYQLEQAVAIARQTGHSAASIVLDPFHLYRGGSGFGGVRFLREVKIAICHFNDAPANPPQFDQRDADRVYPGDGILPLAQMLRDLSSIGYDGYLSIELFNPRYWQADLAEVAKTAYEKSGAVIGTIGE